MEKHAAQRIAMGHNLNDQAETVLMRILRGSGASGLSGIAPCREGVIIRPLIGVSRKEIEQHLESRNLAYVTDASNLEAHCLRNRVRLELMPELERYQPRIVEILGQMSHLVRTDDARLATEAECWVKQEARSTEGGGTCISVRTFTVLPEALKGRVLRYVIRETSGSLRRIGLRHIEAILQIASGDKPHSHVDLPKGVTVKRVYDELVFTQYENPEAEDFCYTIPGPGRFELPDIGRSVLLEELERVNLPNIADSQRVAFLNADRIVYPLLIRNFRAGDRFVPLGMTGHRKLKDFFIDLKVPHKVRRRTPLLVCGDTPVWVCGFRIDHRFKVTARTNKILKVTFVDGGALAKSATP
jgi:tRNA(Ile)-lysidine synthase